MKTNHYAPLGSKLSAGISLESGAVDRFVYYRRLVAPTFIMYCIGVWKIHLWVAVKGRGIGWND